MYQVNLFRTPIFFSWWKHFYHIVTDAIWIGKPNQLLARLRMNGITDSESIIKAKELMASLSDEWIRELFEVYKDNPKIKWKESIKKVVNIEIPTEKGLYI